MSALHADLLIARDSTRSLFRANMERENRKKRSKGYVPAFGRVLTEAEATRHREEEAKKMEIASQKKEATEARKLAVAAKKLDEDTRRRVRESERAEKRRIKAEEKAIKAAGVIDRKRKREEVKMQRELERLQRPKRVYRKKLRQPSVQENFSSIPVDPALQPEGIRARSLTPGMGGYVYPEVSSTLTF